MERTRNNIKSVKTMSDVYQLQVLASAVAARANFAAKLGVQFDGARDLYQALGYRVALTYQDYYNQYKRQDIAKAIIDRPVKATWQGQLELVESQDADRTEFEQAWFDLNKKFHLRSVLSRVDRLTGIGRYGVLLLGLDDVSNQDGFANPVRLGKRKLKYIKPFGEASAKVIEYETNPKNPRYGMPTVYNIQVSNLIENAGYTVEPTINYAIRVHYSRIIHITDDNLESEIYGAPRLEAVFNRLMDIEKIVGGDAEMFWKGARPGYQGMVDKDFTMTQETKDDLKDQIDEFDHNLRRILINEGVDLKALAQQISDPASHMDVQLTCVSAVTGIPKRILSGSERGELASTQDTGEWKTYVQSRREDHAEPDLIYPFVEKLIDLEILPKPSAEYTVDWLDLFSISEKERVEIGKSRANAIREYTTNPIAQSIMPPDAFFELCLGLSTQQIELVEKMIAAGLSEDQVKLIKSIQKVTTPATLPLPTGRPIPGQPVQRTKPAVKVA
jgi:hypothetical protein